MNDQQANQNREAAYSGLMENQIAAFCEATAMGSSHLEDIAEHHFKAAFEGDNFDMNAAMKILNVDEKLTFSADLPRILARKLGAFLMEEAEIEGHMDVSASTSESQSMKATSGFEGSGKIGYGPVSIGIKVHGSAGVESSRKRSTDYRAGVKWRVLMKRQTPPEAIMLIVDALCKFLVATTDINISIGTAIAERVKARLTANDGSEDDGFGDSSDTDDDFGGDSGSGNSDDDFGNDGGSDDGFGDSGASDDGFGN